MSKTDIAKSKAIQIRDEVEDGRNTARRVGEALLSVIEGSDEQVSELALKVDEIQQELVSPSSQFVRGYIKSDGSIVDSEAYVTSGFVTFRGKTITIATFAQSAVKSMAFYDADRKYIAGTAQSTSISGDFATRLADLSIAIPDNAVYVRFTNKVGKLVVEYDNLATLPKKINDVKVDVVGVKNDIAKQNEKIESLEGQLIVYDAKEIAATGNQSGYVNRSGGISDSSNARIYLYDVTEGQRIKIEQTLTSSIGSNTYATWALYNSATSFDTSTKTDIGANYPASDTTINDEIVVGSGGKKLIVTIHAAKTSSLVVSTLTEVKLPDRLIGISNAIDNIDNQLTAYDASKIDVSSIRDGYYVDKNCDIQTSSTGLSQIRIFNVTEGQRIRIEQILSSSMSTGIYKSWALYNSTTTFDSTTKVDMGEQIPSSEKNIEAEFSVRSGGKTLVVTTHKDKTSSISVSILTKVSVSDKLGEINKIKSEQDSIAERIKKVENACGKSLSVNISNGGDTISVMRQYTKDATIKNFLKRHGVNQLMQLADIQVRPSTIGWSDVGTTTDWVSPYTVAAVNNIDGDDPTESSEHITGGCHDYNGFATARHLSTTMYADGEIVSEEGTHTCNEFVVINKHRVQAGNTAKANGSGREVLEETTIYTFKDDKIFVNVNIKALEDIVISKYYGTGIYGYKDCYAFSGVKNIHAEAGAASHEIKVTNNPVSFDAVGSRNSYPENKVLIHLDNKGIAQGHYSDYSWLIGVSNKWYSCMIYDHDCPLSQGDEVSWSGYYRFYREFK